MSGDGLTIDCRTGPSKQRQQGLFGEQRQWKIKAMTTHFMSGSVCKSDAIKSKKLTRPKQQDKCCEGEETQWQSVNQ